MVIGSRQQQALQLQQFYLRSDVVSTSELARSSESHEMQCKIFPDFSRSEQVDLEKVALYMRQNLLSLNADKFLKQIHEEPATDDGPRIGSLRCFVCRPMAVTLQARTRHYATSTSSANATSSLRPRCCPMRRPVTQTRNSVPPPPRTLQCSIKPPHRMFTRCQPNAYAVATLQMARDVSVLLYKMCLERDLQYLIDISLVN